MVGFCLLAGCSWAQKGVVLALLPPLCLAVWCLLIMLSPVLRLLALIPVQIATSAVVT